MVPDTKQLPRPQYMWLAVLNTCGQYMWSVHVCTFLFRLVSTELLEGDFYACANTKHTKDG